MITSLGKFAAERRRWVVIAALLFTLVAGVWGTQVFGAITGGAGFDDPNSESTRADKVLAGPLGRQQTDVVVLYHSSDQRVEDPGFATKVRAAVDAVPREDLTRLDSYWSTGNSSDFISKDGHSTYVALQFKASDDQDRVKALQKIEDRFKVPDLDVSFGGVTAMTEQVNALTGKDIGRAEMLSVPLLLLLLVLIFRSAIAALLPLATGTVVALGSFTVLRVITYFVQISSSVINVITILGLGLAIDYALFMVSRFREELASGTPLDLAVQRTTASAGRTVAFSGLAVAISFASLTLFPSRFLSSMGYAAVSVVAFAVLSSLTVLPALLRIIGHRVNSGRIPMPWGRGQATARPETEGRWYRTAKLVMRRPALITAGAVALLLALGTPFLGVNWARPGDWVLPSSSDARVVTRQLGTEFNHDPNKVVTAVVEFGGAADAAKPALDAYAQRLDAVPGVSDAAVTATQDNTARITMRYAMDPMSSEANTMVHDLRAQTPPDGAEALFTGMPASRVDIVNMIGTRLPWMALFVAVISSLVLFLAFGSVTIPLKSVVLNLLSLTAAFGAIKWIFQDGHLHGLLGFTPIGAIDANFPVLIVAIAFGLAMDYEVFLLSRIKESHDRGASHEESIAIGLQRTGGIITSAALLLIVVVCGFLTSSIAFMQMIGVGLVIAIAVDATLVRAIMVPATMRLLGRWAWWAPRPLAALWQRFNLSHTEEPVTGSPDRTEVAV
ncbi:MMPL family transporter [Kitasatospora sp. SUK 42]|uniref:MMPL family transporter n=1 Tax=Kitasatospora sp. SUK 42 TaxID=1588882 RepID=UPI0018CA631A|nr:MMPL family transporter [Kitasatospora sp. SUK 42]MBV2154798.1 MMPL family transporter [Kitasatospora sp. SUK 42]